MSGAAAQSVQRLKGAYRGRDAAVVMGGTSLIDQNVDLARLRSKGMVTFLESKALTPRLLASGFAPDYFLMLSPEKCMSNGFHNWGFRAALAGFNLDRFVKPEYLPVLREMRTRFDEYFEPGKPSRGAHKTYRWRTGLQLKASPCELLSRIPNTRILAERRLLAKYCPQLDGANETYLYDQDDKQVPFDLETYYTVREEDDRAIVSNSSFQNSAAIALYPLLRYLGFRTAYFIGMDMSMLGSMEYGAPYTFKSMWHFRWFFRRSRHVFNANFRQNRPWFLRPQEEFDALKTVIDPEKIDLVRVFEPYRYTVPIPFMHTVSAAEFWAR